jgi:hypothetical protein
MLNPSDEYGMIAIPFSRILGLKVVRPRRSLCACFHPNPWAAGLEIRGGDGPRRVGLACVGAFTCEGSDIDADDPAVCRQVLKMDIRTLKEKVSTLCLF